MSQFTVRMIRHGNVSLGVLAVLIATPGAAAGQEAREATAAAAPAQGVQEIVVTAQRREENLQKVPVSVTALSGSDLAARAIVDSTDIVKLVPALKYNAYSPSTTVYNLRGVSQNDYSDQLEPPVAVYQDDSYLSSMATAGFPLFDIERVEVLRGPQGTLFGRNATGGAIQYISRKPTNSFSLDASATWFSDGGYAVEAGAGGPVTDSLGVRFAIARVKRDSFVKSNNPAIGDSGETDQFAGRVQLLWKPTPDLKIFLRAMRSKDDNSIAGGTYTYTPAVQADHGRGVTQSPTDDFWGTGPGVDPNGYVKPASYGLYENNNNVPSIFSRMIQAYTGRIDWSVGDVTIISITDYQRMSKFYQEDCDGTPLNGCIFAPRTSLRQFSQELRAEGNTGRLQWVSGVNYIDIDGHYQSHAEYNLIALDYFSTGNSNYFIRTKSPSVFAQGTYDLTDKLKFSLGARYTRDKKTDDYQLDFTSSLGDALVEFNPTTNPTEARKRYNLYSGKAQFDYSPSDNIMLFAGVTRGTKSGNFSAPVSAPVVVTRLPHGPEVLWDYEAGIKSKFLDNRLRINASAFYYDYHNYQAFSLIDLVQTISNHDAWVYGGELEVTAVPVEGLNISGGVSYLKSKVKGIGLPDGTITDSQLPQAPRWSGNASISYTLPVGSGDLTARVDGTFTSSFCFSVVCAPIEQEKAYQTLDGSLSYKFKDFTLTAFAKNLTGEKYRTYALDVSALGFLESIYARPRYYGVTLAVNYGH